MKPINGQYTNRENDKLARPIRQRMTPENTISFIPINREEYASAEAGVPTGRQNAKLLGKITVMAANAGFIS